MSIGLVIASHGPTQHGDFIPIATEESFQKYWQPGCIALHLQWVPLFRAGLPLQHEDISAVIEELGLLKHWLSCNTAMAVPHDVVLRIEQIIHALRKIQGDTPVEVYIG